MICPYCQTENRDDRENCYYCTKDLSMLRLIVNKAKHHYNQGLEFAERGHLDDAIVELKNALDLDGSMDAAHIVLGTLYAKKEMFTEARESWQKALTLNHHYEKAHEYLTKAEKAEYVFPAMKRLKWVAGVLGGLLLAALVATICLTVNVLSPDPNLEGVRKATALLKSDKPETLPAVEDQLSDIDEGKNVSPLAKDLAGNLRSHLKHQEARRQREIQERLSLAANVIDIDSPYAGHQILDSLKDKKLEGAAEQSMRRLHERANQRIFLNVQEAHAQFLAGTIPFEMFREQTTRFLAFNKAGTAHPEVAQWLKSAEKINHERMMAEATAMVAQSPISEAARQLVDWQARHPELAKPLRALMDQRLENEAAKIQNAVAASIEQKQFDVARQQLKDLPLLYQGTQQHAPENLVRQLGETIEAAQHKAALEEVEQAYQAKDYKKFFELTGNLDKLATGSTERAKLTQMLAEARKTSAAQTWDWLSKRGAAFESGKISPEDAAYAAENFQAALQNLPEELSTNRAAILFAAAAAKYKLGFTDEALGLAKQVREQYPKSRAAKSAGKLAKRIETDRAPKPEKALKAKPAPAAKGEPKVMTGAKKAQETKQARND